MKKSTVTSYQGGRFRRHFFPVMIWLLAVSLVSIMFMRRSRHAQLAGLVQGHIYHVTAPVQGRLKNVNVKLFEDVQKGQVVATLDERPVMAKMKTISAEIEHLKAQLNERVDALKASADNREADWFTRARQYTIDVEQAKLKTMQLAVTLQTDRIKLTDLQLEVDILKNLLKEKAVAPYEVQKAQVQYNILAEKIKENQAYYDQAAEVARKAQKRLNEFNQLHPVHPSFEAPLEETRKAIAVQERLIDEVKLQREALVLKAPVNGTIVQLQQNIDNKNTRRVGENILRHQDETVLPGDLILTIAQNKPAEIIAYLDEDMADRVKVGQQVRISKENNPGQSILATITNVGPSVDAVPIRLLRNINVPQWGRPFLVNIKDTDRRKLQLLPGEKVGITLLK